MLNKLVMKNFTVFKDAELKLGKNLNFIVGENGTGKSRLLKVAYSVLALIAEERGKPNSAPPTKSALQVRLAEKLVNVFRPESLGRLVRRQPGRQCCDVTLVMAEPGQSIEFSFATQSPSEVVVEKLPEQWLATAAAHFPAREQMSIFPNFVSIYDGHYSNSTRRGGIPVCCWAPR